MSEADALLAAIRQAPDDDAPRLIYADWLDEHGQPERAEFIRIQIQPSAFRSPKLLKREMALSSRLFGKYMAECADRGLEFTLERGFANYFRTPTEFFDVTALNVERIKRKGLPRIRVDRPLVAEIIRFSPDGTLEWRIAPMESNAEPGFRDRLILAGHGNYSLAGLVDSDRFDFSIDSPTHGFSEYRAKLRSSTLDWEMHRDGAESICGCLFHLRHQEDPARQR